MCVLSLCLSLFPSRFPCPSLSVLDVQTILCLHMHLYSLSFDVSFFLMGIYVVSLFLLGDVHIYFLVFRHYSVYRLFSLSLPLPLSLFVSLFLTYLPLCFLYTTVSCFMVVPLPCFLFLSIAVNVNAARSETSEQLFKCASAAVCTRECFASVEPKLTRSCVLQIKEHAPPVAIYIFIYIYIYTYIFVHMLMSMSFLIVVKSYKCFPTLLSTSL